MDKGSLITFLGKETLASAEARHTIAEHFKKKSLAKHEMLLTAGEISDDYLFLESGFMRAFATDTEGNDVTTNFFTQGQVIFEVSSFFTRIRSQENIQALTDCEGWSITYQQLNTLFHAMPEFRELGRAILVKGFAQLKTRMLSMITETAEERYSQLLTTKPEILQHAPLKNVASFLGITDTSLSRIRKELSRK